MRRITHLSRQRSSSSITLEAAVAAFYQRCEARNLSPHTISFYKYRLLAFRRFLEEKHITVGLGEMATTTIREFLAHEKQRVSVATADDSHVALSALFRFLENDELIEKNPLKGIERMKLKKTIVPTFSAEQIEAMLSQCDRSFICMRDRAIIPTLVDCGLRVSELIGLKAADINWTDQTMVVLGKGNNERSIPFGRTARSAMLTYQQRRGDITNTCEFFLTCYGDGMSRLAINRTLKTLAATAKITGVRVSPHTFRHTFAVMYLRNGGDVFSLQKLLGHTDLTMTRRYAELSQMDVVAKHRQFSPADAIKPVGQLVERRRQGPPRRSA